MYNNVKDDVFVRADKNTTDTIIRNIIANALKFTPKEGKIDVNAEIKNSDIEIKITDNGVGMNSEKLEKILDSKEHYTEQGTEGEIGSGIGLPLCFEFIKMNNGKYQIYSEEGKGTQFEFTLPNYLE